MGSVNALEQAISDYYFQTNFSRDDTELFADYITNWLRATGYVIKRAEPPCRGYEVEEHDDAA